MNVKKFCKELPLTISPSKMSRQNLRKAVKCVTKALPKSPSKKKSVVCALTKSFGIMNTDKKVINLGLSTCDKEAIQNFYQQKRCRHRERQEWQEKETKMGPHYKYGKGP